jgi:hypothetical protein
VIVYLGPAKTISDNLEFLSHFLPMRRTNSSGYIRFNLVQVTMAL